MSPLIRSDGSVNVGRAWLYSVATALGIAVLAISLWAFGVFTSGVRGAGNVIKQNNDANNRIAAQNEFNRLWGDIQGYKADIDATAAQVAFDKTSGADPSADFDTLTAEQQTCRSAVGTYNADTLDVTLKDWRPAADPAQIDQLSECGVTP